jgi:hypothetical protein
VLRTTVVCAAIADREPASFRAVTRKRSVRPRSASATVYWLSVAPLISMQLPPLVSQRSQRNEYVIGWFPLHVPRLAINRLPGEGVPEIVGAPVFVGRADVT